MPFFCFFLTNFDIKFGIPGYQSVALSFAMLSNYVYRVCVATKRYIHTARLQRIAKMCPNFSDTPNSTSGLSVF